MKYARTGLGALVLAGVAAVATLRGCSSDREVSRAVTRVPDPTDVIDHELMIALGQAKNYHHKAKIYMTDGNPGAATAAVRQILSLRFPPGAPEADDVRNDARAMLAKLQLGQGQIDEATRTIDEGIAASRRDSFFVANLYTVQGEIHESRARAADSAGDAGVAAGIAERRAAIASYDRSIQINERLQVELDHRLQHKPAEAQ